MVASGDGHAAGGTNDGKAVAAATAVGGGSGVLTAVRFTTADMSVHHSTHIHILNKYIYAAIWRTSR